MAGSDLPAVIINVQRGGPGLGGIQPSQADYWQATKATGHGDFQILVFAPSTVQEMVDLISHAFDTADKYRMPAMMLADGMLGQMMEPVELPEEGSAQLPEKEWAAKGHGGKRAHNIINSLYLTPEKLEELVQERFAALRAWSRPNEQMAEEYLTEDAEHRAGGLWRLLPRGPQRREQGPGKGHQGGPGPAHHPVALPRHRH